jgi:hypothetical protein
VALSGWVALAGDLHDELGAPTGRRLVRDGDGIPVELTAAGTTVASAATQDGRFAFGGVAPGSYRLRLRVGEAPPLESDEVLVAQADVVLADTLLVEPAGELRTYPNPATRAHGIGFEFEIPTDQALHFRVLSLQQATVWDYSEFQLAGFIHVHWSPERGTAEGVYWGLAYHDGAWHYNLLFLEG